MNNIKILGIDIYHGEKEVYNDFYIDHYKKNPNIDIERLKKLYKSVGREKRYIIDNDDTTLSMAIKASKKVLKQTNLKGEDIDLIIFSSQLPEYVAPPSSSLIHKEIHAKETCQFMDLNLNCAGMVFSLSIIKSMMNSNKNINKVLLVGCDNINLFADKNNIFIYGFYGDVACATIFEKTNDDSNIISYNNMIDYSDDNLVRFPRCGFSNIKNDISSLTAIFNFPNPSIKSTIKSINKTLQDGNINIDDIDLFCFSQFSKKLNKQIIEKLNIDEKKVPYIADQYGYTGTTSPFLVLYEKIKNNELKRGDLILFWTIGIGESYPSCLIKF